MKTRDEKSVFFLEERREDERFFLRNFSIEKIGSLHISIWEKNRNSIFFVFRIELVYKEFLGHLIIHVHTAYVTRIRNF